MKSLYQTKKDLTREQEIFWLTVETMLHLTLYSQAYHYCPDDEPVPEGKRTLLSWLTWWIDSVHVQESFEHYLGRGPLEAAWILHQIIHRNENAGLWGMHPGYEREYWRACELEWRVKNSYLLLCIMEHLPWCTRYLDRGDPEEARFKAWEISYNVYDNRISHRDSILEAGDKAVQGCPESEYSKGVTQEVLDEWLKTRAYLEGLKKDA